MPIAKWTNTSKRMITIVAEGGEYEISPGSDIAANFSDEEWRAAKLARAEARAADKLPDDEKAHLDTIERDKGWVAWRDKHNADVEKERQALEKAQI